ALQSGHRRAIMLSHRLDAKPETTERRSRPFDFGAHVLCPKLWQFSQSPGLLRALVLQTFLCPGKKRLCIVVDGVDSQRLLEHLAGVRAIAPILVAPRQVVVRVRVAWIEFQ